MTPAQVLSLAQHWANGAGWALQFLPSTLATDVVTLPPEKQALLACAHDVYRLACQSPEGRQALRDLGLEPVLQHVEGE